jgi:hypothetical protein
MCHSTCDTLVYFEIEDIPVRLIRGSNYLDVCPSSSYIQPDPKSDVVCIYSLTSLPLT